MENKTTEKIRDDRGKRVRRCVALYEKTYAEIDELLETAGAENRNEFIEYAVKFYIGFLRTKRAETYLLSTFNSAIHGTIGGVEQRMSRVLYKLAVEVAMQNRIIAYDKHFAESAIEQIREISEKEVREIIGYWEK